MAADTLRALDAAVASGVAYSDPVVTASEILFRLLQAHPFVDGNGRVARAVANWVLQQGGYCLINDPRSYCREQKAAYYEALAIRQGLPPHSYDPGPWNAFFSALVSDCYQPRVI
jgi:Fic family protein